MAESNFVDYVKSTAARVRAAEGLHTSEERSIYQREVLMVVMAVEVGISTFGLIATIGPCCICVMIGIS